ncbi:hypothetical protein BTR14_20580 [Rhizobium rhizosphaerae]|uniref:Uncharacterized protein n=1 Tax=Xaviernesmea rhizosphaerae TaxID=1672749 RepID=A0ABX3P9D1_9HYPH|nr:hypothetical protein [Xaviernesmea rhizosphaerae]OQP84201.1 hypothetical protein BTR14_20580 [Xaviernesmea rhizosphaerae]
MTEPQEIPITRQKRWQNENPLKRWAHIAVQSAINRGLLERKPCEVCGAERTDAHHTDYHRPLSVRWLCRKHHIAVHREAEQPEADQSAPDPEASGKHNA